LLANATENNGAVAESATINAIVYNALTTEKPSTGTTAITRIPSRHCFTLQLQAKAQAVKVVNAQGQKVVQKRNIFRRT
jgi:hypothetical protein